MIITICLTITVALTLQFIIKDELNMSVKIYRVDENLDSFLFIVAKSSTDHSSVSRNFQGWRRGGGMWSRIYELQN